MGNKMRLILALAFAGALVVPTIAKAEVQNVKVSGDITIYGIYREDYDLIKDSKATNQDSKGYYASIVKVRVDADLTDNVAATIRLLNERDWDTETVATTDIDMDLAYITLKEILYSPLTLTIGRQEIKFGNELIMGESSTNLADALTAADLREREAFDAIRATWDLDPLTVDAVIVKINETVAATNNDHDLYGINAVYNVSDNADVSAYWFADIDEAPALTLTGDGEPAARTYEENDTYVLGIAGNSEPVDNLTLSGEVAYQFGEISDKTWVGGQPTGTKTKDRKAWALDLAATYAFDSAYSPTLGARYIFRSGEEAGNNGDYEAWNPLYEDQTIGVLADVILGGTSSNNTNGGVQSNASIINVNGSIQPMEDLTLSVDYYNYTLDENFNGGTLTSGANAYTMTSDDDAGDEVDITLTYDYTEDVQIGLMTGFFWPGNAFAASNNDDATEVLASIKVNF